jgi:hypothetical protein
MEHPATMRAQVITGEMLHDVLPGLKEPYVVAFRLLMAGT